LPPLAMPGIRRKKNAFQSISLPLLSPRENGLDDLHQVDYLLGGQKILIVEDTRTNAVFLENLLKPLQKAIITAENGEEGLKLFKVENVGIILLDLVMPVMDGFAMLKRRLKFG